MSNDTDMTDLIATLAPQSRVNVVVPDLYPILAHPGAYVSARDITIDHPFVRPDAIIWFCTGAIVGAPLGRITRMQERDRIDIAVIVLVEITEVDDIFVVKIVESIAKSLVKIC
jgi:hypothetical protein